jgi:acyl carrier protein
MTQGAILAYMVEYFQKGDPTLTAESLAEQSVLKMLTDSLDVVEFLMFMEDKLGQELAGEILRRLPDPGAATS